MQLFQFQNDCTGKSMAVSVLEKGGQAWFVATDVCTALGLHRTAIRRLDDDEKDVHKTHTPGGLQEVAVINESGLYSLIFSSNKAAAKTFKKWVTKDVIPSIRKHGGYINGQEVLKPEDLQETLQVIHEEARRVGQCALEEKDARADTFRFLKTGRLPHRTP